ncbi:MAG: hypothetical protein WBD93_12775, partial [Acidobacteriaceae bacterium]
MSTLQKFLERRRNLPLQDDGHAKFFPLFRKRPTVRTSEPDRGFVSQRDGAAVGMRRCEWNRRQPADGVQRKWRNRIRLGWIRVRFGWIRIRFVRIRLVRFRVVRFR